MSVKADNQVNGGFGVVSDVNSDDGLYPVTGIAIGPYDLTRGHLSGEKKLWRPEVLEEAAQTLQGKKIVVNHENRDAREVVGEILEAKYDEDRGVVYRGEIDDDELASKIEKEWLDVSPRIIHDSDMEERDGIKIPQTIHRFDNLSIVSKGAAKSNELRLGNPEELAAEIDSEFDIDDERVAEYQEVELQESEDNFSEYLYDDRSSAEGASESLGCSGSHEHTIEGERWYMPCNSHDEFLRNYSRQKGNSEEMQENSENPSMKPQEGQTVRWQPMPTVVGRVVHVDSEKDIAMVEVEEPDSASGMTFTAGYQDVVPMDMTEIEELQLSEARTPDYDGTEESSWADVSKDMSSWMDALDYEGVDSVEDLTEEQRSEIASHTLLGDSGGETWDEISYFPVVNPNTGNLNRGALEAVRGGRGQSADISESTYESAYEVAGRLLNEEFDSEVEVEMEELASYDEMKRMAGQMSSMSPLTRDEARGLLRVFDPSKPEEAGPLADSLERTFDVERDEVLEVLRAIGITENSGHGMSKDEMEVSSDLDNAVDELSELEAFEDVESDELHEALSELIDSDEDSVDSTEENNGMSSIKAENLEKTLGFE